MDVSAQERQDAHPSNGDPHYEHFVSQKGLRGDGASFEQSHHRATES